MPRLPNIIIPRIVLFYLHWNPGGYFVALVNIQGIIIVISLNWAGFQRCGLWPDPIFIITALMLSA